MKPAAWLLLSGAVVALPFFLGPIKAVATTNDIGTLCRAAGFVGPNDPKPPSTLRALQYPPQVQR